MSEAPPPLGGRPLRGWRLVRCGSCGLPTERCLCDELPPVSVRTRVHVVMHHLEALRSTNTGRLAARTLGATIHRRGLRDERPEEPPPDLRRLVLFPSEGARPLRADDAREGLVLVVPDGTWAQARRASRRDPWCAGAEHVALPAGGVRRYDLRASERENALSTYEALAAALGILEGPSVEGALREGFDRWLARARAVRTA